MQQQLQHHQCLAVLLQKTMLQQLPLQRQSLLQLLPCKQSALLPAVLLLSEPTMVLLMQLLVALVAATA